MTEGEKMVWAAAFVARLNRYRDEPPPPNTSAEEKGAEASDAAWAAVYIMRRALSETDEQYLGRPDAFILHQMMVSGESE
jgi:hypothetical protein